MELASGAAPQRLSGAERALRERSGSTCATCTRSKRAKSSQVLGGVLVVVAKRGLEKKCTEDAVHLRLFTS